MSNIEDDIKILTEENSSYKKEQAMQNILSEREQDKARIKELESKLEEANKQLDLDYVDENYIPKQKAKEMQAKIKELEEELYSANKIINEYLDGIPKQVIKDKIDEINREEQELQKSISEEEREEYADANISYLLCDFEIRKEVLRELMEDK